MSFCPCCLSKSISFFFESGVREYARCSSPRCGAAFLLPAHHLSPDIEESRYDLHNNDVAQEGYVRFLSPLMQAMRAGQRLGDRGLDFGCGPTESLRRLMAADFRWQVYDLYFYPDDTVFEETFDFIAASEVFEHLRDPRFELARLRRSLVVGGSLWIMTSLYRGDDTDFGGWHYRRDPTHVVFYTEESFQVLAAEFGFEAPVFFGDRVIQLRRRV